MIVDDSPNESFSEESEAMSLIADNLMRLKNEMTGRSVPTSSASRTRREYGTSPIPACYEEFVEKLPPQFKTMTYDQKIQYLLQQRELGAIVCLFQLVYHFREALAPKALVAIAQQLTNNLNLESEMEIRCTFELLAYIGVIDHEMIQNIYKLVLEESLPVDIGVLYLANMGILGLEALVEMAGGQFNEIPLETLRHLAKSEMVIQEVLIPTLMNDLHSNLDNKRKTIVVAVLNRLFNLTCDHKVTSALSKVFQEGTLDRSLVASTLRSSGLQGEKELLRLLKSNSNNKNKIPIIGTMPWRVPQQMVMQIEVVEYSIASGFLPGNMYRYQGSLEPASQVNTQEPDVLSLNTRDFLAALNRLVASNIHQSSSEHQIRQSEFNCNRLSLIMTFIKQKEAKQSPILMSEEVVKAITYCLSSPVVQVRQASLNALGLIGLPETNQSLERIAKCLNDPESNIRSAACWALSNICRNPSQKIVKRLAELLRDSFWKVRNSACLTISTILQSPNELVIQALVRCLKDGSINRQTVCQTLVRLGPIGEQVLVEILKATNPTDIKIKSAIIISFQLANVGSPAIDYLIQQLFKHCSDQNPVIRALCLECLNSLRLRSTEQNITYLKAKNILPLFYYFLEDSSSKLRDLAVDAILSFGSHAQLIFIQGLTKSPNPIIRCECVKGLTKMGAQNFRAVLFGLRDSDQRVRRMTSCSILQNLPLQQVVSQFQYKHNHIPTLVCHLKQILQSQTVPPQMYEYLQQLLSTFSLKKHESRRSAVCDQNFQVN